MFSVASQSTTVSGAHAGTSSQDCNAWHISSSAILRLGLAFHRLSSTKPLTSGGYDYEPASKQRDVTSSTRCNQPALFRANKRYHTTTGSFESHPHFIEENSYAFVCLNISNILLTHKYTQHTQLHNFLRNRIVDEFCKSVYTCQSYDQKSSVLLFFWWQCIYGLTTTCKVLRALTKPTLWRENCLATTCVTL